MAVPRERDDCLDLNNCNSRKALFVCNIKVAMIKSFYFCTYCLHFQIIKHKGTVKLWRVRIGEGL